MQHKQVLRDEAEAQVKYFGHGVEAAKKAMLKLVRELSKEYDKAIHTEHLIAELKELKVSIINTDR